MVMDVNSPDARFRTMKDTRKAKGLRYPLVDILVMITLAKLCGQDKPSGIAEWVKNRSEQLQ
jgi:hypothetical protein